MEFLQPVFDGIQLTKNEDSTYTGENTVKALDDKTGNWIDMKITISNIEFEHFAYWLR